MNKAINSPLVGEQKRVYELDLSETVLVKGSAGCGKTTVALARARQYLHDQPDMFSGGPKVLFVSYTNALIDYISFNDPSRFDGREDCINLSIQRPNTALLARFQSRFPRVNHWYMLLLDPCLCADLGVVFTTGNAASSIVKHEGSGTGETAFYTWVYCRALHHPQNRTLADKLVSSDYTHLTDIEYNPGRTLNSQSFAAAYYLHLIRSEQADTALSTPESFLAQFPHALPAGFKGKEKSRVARV